MDFYDIASGVAGFFVFFGIYLVWYLIFGSKIENRLNNENKELTDHKDSIETNEKKTKK